LHAIGNLLSIDGSSYQGIFNYSLLPYLHALLGSSDQYIRKDVCWIISKITAENESQIQVKHLVIKSYLQFQIPDIYCTIQIMNVYL